MSEKEPKTVLVVDNDSSVRSMLADMVRSMGHRTIVSERVTRAAQVLAEQPVDAMLLDLHMPGPHGQDLLRFLKKKQISPPPTIVVSGYLKEASIGELLRLGVSGVIAKPFDAQRLRDELGRVLADPEDSPKSFCSQCGAEAREGDRFCRNCGNGLERELACPGCEASYSPGDRFCGECGTRLVPEDKEL